MKVKVIKTFRDKYTKVIYQKNEEIEVTNERFKEINSAAHGPFVEEIIMPDPPPTRTVKEGKRPKNATKK